MVYLSAPLGGSSSKKVLSDELDWTSLASSLGPQLTVGDLLHHDTRRAADAKAHEDRLLALAAQYNQIRQAWKGPIRVVSAFCPEPFNRQVCGKENSLHAVGMALDLVPLDGDIDHFHNWLSKRWSGGLGHGVSKGSVHIDTRCAGHFSSRANLKPVILWTY